MKRAVVPFFITNQIGKAIQRLYDRMSKITDWSGLAGNSNEITNPNESTT